MTGTKKAGMLARLKSLVDNPLITEARRIFFNYCTRSLSAIMNIAALIKLNIMAPNL